MKRLSNKECYDKLVGTQCYLNTVHETDKKKVEKARAGTNPTTPGSWIAQVAAELGLRAHADAGTTPPPPPPPPPSPPEGYAPQAYNKGQSGQNARYNVHINCTQTANGDWVDRMGVVYDDGGRQRGNLRSEQMIDGLKGADMMDNKEPWDAYEWMGQTFPPYPPQSYER